VFAFDSRAIATRSRRRRFVGGDLIKKESILMEELYCKHPHDTSFQ
jgi:hypothetical protein